MNARQENNPTRETTLETNNIDTQSHDSSQLYIAEEDSVVQQQSSASVTTQFPLDPNINTICYINSDNIAIGPVSDLFFVYTHSQDNS
jgi:hypothetical protein